MNDIKPKFISVNLSEKSLKNGTDLSLFNKLVYTSSVTYLWGTKNTGKSLFA